MRLKNKPDPHFLIFGKSKFPIRDVRCLSNCCFSTFWFILSSCFILSLPASCFFFLRWLHVPYLDLQEKVVQVTASYSVLLQVVLWHSGGAVHELSTGCEEITRKRSKVILQGLTAMQGSLPTWPSHFHMFWTDKINFVAYYFLSLPCSKELKNRHAIFFSVMASSLFSSTFAF